MTLVGMIHTGTVETIHMKSFIRPFHSNAVVDALVEKLHKDSGLAQETAEPIGHTTKEKAKEGVGKKDSVLIDQLPPEIGLSSKAFDDSSVVQSGAHRRNKKITRKHFPDRKGRKSENELCSFSSLSLSVNKTE